MTDSLSKPPDAVPSCYEHEIQKLTRQAKSILDLKAVPYYIQASLASEGYVTVEDLADRWDKAEDARARGPKELKFEPGTAGYSDEFSKLCAMRLYQAVKMAKISSTGTVAISADTQNVVRQPSGLLEMACDRAQLEIQYQLKTKGGRPPLEDQGSDTFLKKQFKFCMKGQIGFFTSKQIVSFLPEADERPTKRRRYGLGNLPQGDEDDEEFRSNPTTMRQLERLHRVFQTNLLMCIYAFPQFSELEIEKRELDEFYNWLYGPTIASRMPQPSIQTVMMAERNAWREITRKMHLGSSLRTALAEIKSDLLFWQREVYERIQSSPQPKGGGKKGKYTYPIQKGYPGKGKGSRFQPYSKKGLGKGGKSKSDKGRNTKGQKGKSTWPQNWAKETPRGVPFCMNYHIKSNCPGSCGRSHNCPVTKDGWVCNAPPESHSPSNCPKA
jgi:hypothetical protein